MGYKCAVITTTIGVILLIASIVLPSVFPSMFETKLEAKLVIAPESKMLEKFTDPPAPFYLNVWLFNITNPEEILNGTKPSLQQVGPYTYRMLKRKVNVTFDHEKGTIRYKIKKFYFFEPGKSAGLESDLITTVNPVFLTLASKIDKIESWMVRQAARALTDRFSNLTFMTHPVGEMLFKGYEDELIKELYAMKEDKKFESGKFGFFYPKNGSTTDDTEMYTGELDMSVYQNIVKYKGKKNLDYWKSSYCNMINGTEGSQFPRPININDTLYFYVSDLCRSIYAVYEKDVYHGPLKLHRFVLPPQLLAFSEENECYCSSDFTCRQSMIDVSPCRDGAPIVISTPHFYQGLDKDINEVAGLNPIKAEHETYLDIEPNTGVTFRAEKRIQINIAFKQYDVIDLWDINEIIMPILWVNESGKASLASAELLYTTLTVPKQTVHYGSWVAFAIGLILIIVGCILFYRAYKQDQIISATKKQKNLEDQYGLNQQSLLSKNAS